MKTLFLVVMFMLSLNSYSQDLALSSFKNIVQKFDTFLKIPQKCIYIDEIYSSYNLIVFNTIQIKAIDISYDIQKTESIVSPYIGTIKIICQTSDNKKYGNVLSPGNKKSIIGFDSEKNAIDAIDSIYTINTNGNARATFSFVFQDNKWIFKPLDMYSNSSSFFYYLYKKQNLIEKESVELNKKWFDLVN